MATARRQITCVDILPACLRQQRHLWAIVAQARQQVGYQTALLPGTHIGRCLCSTGRPICRDLEPQANLFPMGLALQAMPSGSTLAPSRAFTHWQVPARRCTASHSSGQTDFVRGRKRCRTPGARHTPSSWRRGKSVSCSRSRVPRSPQARRACSSCRPRLTFRQPTGRRRSAASPATASALDLQRPEHRTQQPSPPMVPTHQR